MFDYRGSWENIQPFLHRYVTRKQVQFVRHYVNEKVLCLVIECNADVADTLAAELKKLPPGTSPEIFRVSINGK